MHTKHSVFNRKIRLAVHKAKQLPIQDTAVFDALVQVRELRHFREHLDLTLIDELRAALWV